jgi:prepilin signal peptidase PulO-like enzyme (type II secretory pathway)
MFLLFSFVFGIIIGSFLNVVLFRYNTGWGIGGRSKCFSCRRELKAIDLVPILSFLMFKGRCRTCKSKISWQYPSVELLTGVLFAATFAFYSPLLLTNLNQFILNIVFGFVIMALLVLITVYDLKHKIIPDVFVYTFSIVALVYSFLSVDVFGSLIISNPGLMYLIAGPVLAAPFYILWLISAGTWMGLGDAKLALGIGWLLGLIKGGAAIAIGFYIGAIVALFILLFNWLFKRKGISLKSEIPFAPFLITGLLTVFFFGYTVVCVVAPGFCSTFFF